MTEQCLPDIGKNAFADPVDQRRAKIAACGEEHRDDCGADHRAVEQRRILAAKPLIDKIGKAAPHRQQRASHHQQRDHRADNAMPVRMQIGPENTPQLRCREGRFVQLPGGGGSHTLPPVCQMSDQGQRKARGNKSRKWRGEWRSACPGVNSGLPCGMVDDIPPHPNIDQHRRRRARNRTTPWTARQAGACYEEGYPSRISRDHYRDDRRQRTHNPLYMGQAWGRAEA